MGNGGLSNQWGIMGVTNVVYWYVDGYLNMKLSFSYFGGHWAREGDLDVYFTKEGGDQGGPQGWKVIRTNVSILTWGRNGMFGPDDKTLNARLATRIGEVYGSFGRRGRERPRPHPRRGDSYVPAARGGCGGCGNELS
jgi:hypothetical protein